MFWAEHPSAGVCPKGGGHDAQGFEFVLPFGFPPNAIRVDGFFYCNDCHSLFQRNDSQHPLGICAAGGPHDPTDSFEFVLSIDRPGANGQGNWVVCNACSCLFYGPGTATQGSCSGEGDFVIGHGVGSDFAVFSIQFSDSDWEP